MKCGECHVTLIYMCSFSERLAKGHREDTAQCTPAYLPIGMLSIGDFLALHFHGSSDPW